MSQGGTASCLIHIKAGRFSGLSAWMDAGRNKVWKKPELHKEYKPTYEERRRKRDALNAEALASPGAVRDFLSSEREKFVWEATSEPDDW